MYKWSRDSSVKGKGRYSYGVGRIFSRGEIVDFPGIAKNIFPGGPKVVIFNFIFNFTYLKLRK